MPIRLPSSCRKHFCRGNVASAGKLLVVEQILPESLERHLCELPQLGSAPHKALCFTAELSARCGYAFLSVDCSLPRLHQCLPSDFGFKACTGSSGTKRGTCCSHAAGADA